MHSLYPHKLTKQKTIHFKILNLTVLFENYVLATCRSVSSLPRGRFLYFSLNFVSFDTFERETEDEL